MNTMCCYSRKCSVLPFLEKVCIQQAMGTVKAAGESTSKRILRGEQKHCDFSISYHPNWNQQYFLLDLPLVHHLGEASLLQVGHQLLRPGEQEK